MRIMHISDIHGDLRKTETAVNFARTEGVDVLACTGDFTCPILDPTERQAMDAAFDYLMKNVFIEANAPIRIKPRTLCQKIVYDPNSTDKKAEKAANIFLKIDDKLMAEENKVCGEISDMFREIEGTVLTVPGNWDSETYFRNFGAFDIHKKERKVEQTAFAGYGGSMEIPIFLPRTKVIPYSEVESYDFLSRTIPDVALIHRPPWRAKDKLKTENGENNVGSSLTRCYALEKSPKLVLCGHIHGQFGGTRLGSSIVLNAGNLGQFMQDQRCGSFFIAELTDNGDVSGISAYRVRENGSIEKAEKSKVSS